MYIVYIYIYIFSDNDPKVIRTSVLIHGCNQAFLGLCGVFGQFKYSYELFEDIEEERVGGSSS